MIRFALKCDHEHGFESWFQSGAAFDKVNSAGMVSCPTCGSTAVVKTLMAPRIQTARTSSTAPPETAPSATDAVEPMAQPDSQATVQTSPKELEAKIAALKAHVEANSDYVGQNFAKEARAMHDGDAPERAIYGEAKIGEAMSLIEEGIPVAPLPFVPARKTN